jgi:folate-dependent phosphoribosylglycinamide formyltransferase PurN
MFSSNQPRHLNLARELSSIAETVYFVSEINTVFPGKIDDFFNKSETMQEYFQHVIDAETNIFGEINFLPTNVKTLSIKSGDLNFLLETQLSEALKSDAYVVFGASYIKGWLIDFLVENRAINIHMGISPYYRGSSCNFWALYDHNPSHVGATIHMLSKGLDSGDILFHCIPNHLESDSQFDFTMRSVTAAHKGLVETLNSSKIFTMPRIKQNKTLEVRYTRNADFTDPIAREFLDRKIKIHNIVSEYPELLNPLFF